MNEEQIKQLKYLIKCVKYAQGMQDEEKWKNTLLAYLDGVLSGIE